MKRSFLRLVISSVLACWVLGFVAAAVYAKSVTWSESRARAAGVFLVFETLNRLPPDQREATLESLRTHSSVPFAIRSMASIEDQLGRPIAPGERATKRDTFKEHWYFIGFNGGETGLVAGPHNAVIPKGVTPIGFILVVLLLPAIAGFIAIRVQRELEKIERASHALSVGELSARVDNPSGPSNELAASFNEMAERLEQSIRGRQELIQAVSHELGSPLFRLRFHLELLEQGLVSKTNDERFAAMTGELDALDDLVAELLNYIQSDDLKLEPKQFEPTQGLQDLAELARLESPPQRNVDVSIHCHSPVTVFADPRQFHRAIENVLRNAVRCARTMVHVVVEADEESLLVRVQDDGPGIPADLRKRVLAPFARVEADRDRKTGGVGLGLAIVGRIVARHGGSLFIETSPFDGAEVVTSWPASTPRT
ncbi:MAG: ATP-binding protein [Myxococcota bacterium]